VIYKEKKKKNLNNNIFLNVKKSKIVRYFLFIIKNNFSFYGNGLKIVVRDLTVGDKYFKKILDFIRN
jgi:hypothetical protein